MRVTFYPAHFFSLLPDKRHPFDTKLRMKPTRENLRLMPVLLFAAPSIKMFTLTAPFVNPFFSYRNCLKLNGTQRVIENQIRPGFLGADSAGKNY
jgi:hypothetical protein